MRSQRRTPHRASRLASRDGGLALIGGPHDNLMAGAAWAFANAGSTWAQLGAKLVASGETGMGQFGQSVALSAPADTALIGGFADNGFLGAAWSFGRSGTTWTQLGSKVTGGEETGEAEFGGSATALAGGITDNGANGAPWAFTDPPPAGAATGIGLVSAPLNGTVG